MTDFRSIRWANDPNIAARFRQYRRLMDHWERVLPVPIHEVDYEETVADLEAVARRLVAPAAWNGIPPAWSSTAPSGRSAPPASRRSASPSSSGRSPAGRTTKPTWASCLQACRAAMSPFPLERMFDWSRKT